MHSEMTPDTHPPPASKSPEPGIHLRRAGSSEPALGQPGFGLGKHGWVAVETVCGGADFDAAGDGVAVDDGPAGRDDAHAERGGGWIEAQGFFDDGVEEGEVAEILGVREGMRGLGVGGVEGGGEGEELGAEGRLEGGAAGKLPLDVGQGYSEGFMGC